MYDSTIHTEKGTGMKQKFTRTDIHAVLTAAGMEAGQARELTARIVSAMADALAAGSVIELRGLGTLEPRERKGRTGHNPKTLAPVHIPARRVVFFKPSKGLKEAINSQKEIDT